MCSMHDQAWHSMVKRGLHTLKKQEYQFVVVDPSAPPIQSKRPHDEFHGV